MENGSILDVYINLIKDELENNPSPALILAAKYLIFEYNRDFIPDWIATLAGGNIFNFEAVREEAVNEIKQGGDYDDQ
ncbi:MAG: hypothetical protein D6735_10960 [Acidobacteria bacterium]|nr:MAG: hypothetical protein D6735_10960 [Acidobacteriota bacterium]